jgi:hypothetical protein
MLAAMRQSPPSIEASTTQPDLPPKLEIPMVRITLICAFAVLLGSYGTLSARQSDWAQARLACADVGLDPGSSAFDQCVFDLYYSLWNEQNEFER